MQNTDSNYKILIADDSRSDRLLLSALLNSLGHEVKSAESGLSALKKFKDFQPDLVMLDVLMPKLNGYLTAKSIRAKSKDRYVPIIFITGLSRTEDLTACLEYGDDFFTKPYDILLLKAKLKAFQRTIQLYRDLSKQRDELSCYKEMVVTEQKIAKRIFDCVVKSDELNHSNISYLLSPMCTFNGDVLLAAKKPTGDLNIFLGDFTGHGLPAAIGTMPTSDIFHSMTEKGCTALEIIFEINRRLKEVLPPGLFCAAGFIEVDAAKHQVNLWNGGLPPILFYDTNKKSLLCYSSTELPLGILNENDFMITWQKKQININDKIYILSDGIIETTNPSGEMFGDARTFHTIVQSQSKGDVLQALQTELKKFRGAESQNDDNTILELKIT